MPMTTTGFDREVERRLLDHNVRYTTGRRAVVAALAAGDGPRSAAELHAAMGGAVPLSSLYRTLTVLGDAGVVVPHHGAKDLTRFELAEWITGHHHHLVCVDCGLVEDFELDPADERRLHDLVDEVGADVAFNPTAHTLEIEGRCGACS